MPDGDSEVEDEPLAALFAAGVAREPFDAIASAVHDVVLPLLLGGENERALAEAAALAESHVAELRASSPWPVASLACARGCAACCHLRVEVTAFEAGILARALDASARDRAAARAIEVGSLPLLARLQRRAPCAFLAPDGACSVHAVRPLPCRAAGSTVREACERHVAGAETTGSIPIEVWSFAAYRAAYAGLRRALRSVGQDARRDEMHVQVTRVAAEMKEVSDRILGRPAEGTET